MTRFELKYHVMEEKKKWIVGGWIIIIILLYKKLINLEKYHRKWITKMYGESQNKNWIYNFLIIRSNTVLLPQAPFLDLLPFLFMRWVNVFLSWCPRPFCPTFTSICELSVWTLKTWDQRVQSSNSMWRVRVPCINSSHTHIYIYIFVYIYSSEIDI